MKSKAFIAGLAALIIAAIPASIVYAGYAPANRQTYQCITPTNCPGADKVTFNSFTNAPNYGDERAFFDAKDAGNTSAGGYQDKINVIDGQKLVMRVYIHNNANPSKIGQAAATAKNTKMQVLLPTSKKTSHMTAAQIMADNATPGTVSDTVDLSGVRPFTVAFDKNAQVNVTYRPNGQGEFVTRALPSASFANDHTLNANFGDWKGCFEYAALVTFTVTVKMDKEPQPEPKVVCDLLTAKAINGSRKQVSFTAKGTATNGAQITGYVFDFGDGNTQDSTNATVTHEYSRAGTYKATVVVKSTIGNTAVVERCSVTVKITDDKPPVVPPVTPPTAPPVTPVSTPPTKLPETGIGGIAAIFGAVSSISAAAYYAVARRS